MINLLEFAKPNKQACEEPKPHVSQCVNQPSAHKPQIQVETNHRQPPSLSESPKTPSCVPVRDLSARKSKTPENTNESLAAESSSTPFNKPKHVKKKRKRQLLAQIRQASARQESDVAVAELFSPPRFAVEARRHGLSGLSFDKLQGCDLLDPNTQLEVDALLTTAKPAVLICCPPCTHMGGWDHLNRWRRSLIEQARLTRIARNQLRFCVQQIQRQLDRGVTSCLNILCTPKRGSYQRCVILWPGIPFVAWTCVRMVCDAPKLVCLFRNAQDCYAPIRRWHTPPADVQDAPSTK